jgi:Divergent InlB B-repeat domain
LRKFAVLLIAFAGCTAPAAQLTVDHHDVVFDTLAGRPKSEPVSLTFTNTGGERISSLQVALTGDVEQFEIAENGCGATNLGARRSCSVKVALHSDTPGTFDGQLRVWSTAPAMEAAATLSGKAAPAALELSTSPAVMEIGGGETASFSTKVINVGGALSGPVALGSVSPFALQADDCSGRRLAGGEECTLTAIYEAVPTGGANVTRRLDAQADPGGSASIDLAVHVKTRMTISPDIHFGNIHSSNSKTDVLTVKNFGPDAVGPLNVSYTSATGFVVASHCPASLAAGESCTVAISTGALANGHHEIDLQVSPPNLPPLRARADATMTRDSLSVGVEFGGSGAGDVVFSSSSQSGGSLCTASEGCMGTFPNGTTVTLTAMPHGGSSFSGWWGACADSKTATCTLTLPDNGSVITTAIFN